VPNNDPKRLAWLDATRGLAALLVLVDHGVRGTLPRIDNVINQYINLGNFGVMLFFFCSGFIIPVSLESGGLRQFWIRRFFRLYPLFWFSIIVAVVTGSTETTKASYILVNFTMVHGFFGIEDVNLVFWSLGVEILFYVFLSVLFIFNLTKHSTQIAITLIAISILIEGILGIPPWLWSYLATMCIGTVFYRWYIGEAPGRTVIPLTIAGAEW
jgi:peptidoglycan/LPS O-acetylase OafA/YrhL